MNREELKEETKEIVEKYEETLFLDRVFSFWKIVNERYRDGISNPILRPNLWEGYGFKREELEQIFNTLLNGITIDGITYKLVKNGESYFPVFEDEYVKKASILISVFGFEDDPNKIAERLREKEKILEQKQDFVLKTIEDSLTYIPYQNTLSKVVLYYEGREKRVNPFLGTVDFIPKYKVWKAEILKGDEQIYIISDVGISLTAGSRVVIRPMKISKLVENFNDFLNFLAIKNRKKIETFDDFEKIEFFELVEELPQELVDKILEIPNSLKTIFDGMVEKDKLDERIFYSRAMKLVNFSNRARPEFAKYLCHGLEITNTKAFKTAGALIFFGIENLYNSARTSRLLGFSTAEETYPSDLNDKTQPTFLDELTVEKWEQDFFDALPTLLENGVANVGKGGRSVITKTMSTFTFMSNTSSLLGGSEALALGFENFLKHFTSAGQRIGSRIGMILFGNDFKTVDETVNVNEQYIFLFKIIARRINALIEKLMDDKRIKDLLNTPDEVYNKQLDILIQNIDESKEAIRDFCLGQKEAFRHLNGGAFLLAVLNYVLDNQHVLKEGNVDFEKLVEYYDDWKNTLRNWNLKSLENFINELKTVDEQTYIYYSFNAIKQEYLKLFITVVGKAMKEGKIQIGAFYPIAYLEEDFKSLPKKIEKGSYTFFALLVEKITKNLAKTNLLLSPFGIEIKELNKKDYWFKVGLNRAQKLYEILTTEDKNQEEKHTLIQKAVNLVNTVNAVINSIDKEQANTNEQNYNQPNQFNQFNQTLNETISKSEELIKDKSEKQQKSDKSTDKSEDIREIEKVRKAVIEVVYNKPLGKLMTEDEVIIFLKQRDFKEEIIRRVIKGLLQEGMLIMNGDESLDINWSKWDGGG